MRVKGIIISINSLFIIGFIYTFVSSIANFIKANDQYKIIIECKDFNFLGYYIQGYILLIFSLLIVILLIIEVVFIKKKNNKKYIK